jgi:hypothetical protein
MVRCMRIPRVVIAIGALLLMCTMGAACQTARDETSKAEDFPSSEARSPEGEASVPSDPKTVVAGASRPEQVVRVRLAQLPRGRPPRIEYIDWTAVVDPGGTRTELEKGPVEGNEQEGRTYGAFGRFGDGWLTETDSFGSTLVVHAFDGSKASSAGGGSIVATSSDGQRVLMGYPPAVLGPGRTDMVTWRGKGFSRAEAAGFLGRRDVVFSCRGRTYRGHPDGSYDVLPGVASAVATSQTKGWVIGYPKGPDHDVTGVFDAETGRQLLRSPDYTLLGVDPTASLLLGTTDLYPDDLHHPDLVIATSTGRGLVQVSGPGLHWSTPTWEDPRHLLAVAVTPRNVQYVVRIGVDGELDTAAGPSSGDHYDNTVLPIPQS